VIGSVLASTLAVAAGLVVTVAPASARDSITLLENVTSGGDVAAGGGKIFVSANDRIVVADTRGTVTGAITGVSGAKGLVVTPDGTRLYAALSSSGEVAEIDTGSLTFTRRISLAGYPSPSNLSLSGSRLWVGYGISGNWVGGVLGLDLSAAAPTPVEIATRMYGAPLVAGAGNTVVAGETGINPGSLRVYDVSTSPAVLRGVISGHDHDLSNLTDLVITADGSTAISAFATSGYDAWDTTSLTKVRTYGTDPDYPGAPGAVALSPDGAHVAGAFYGSYDSPHVAVYDAATTTRTYQTEGMYGSNLDLRTGTLAFSGNDAVALLEDRSRGRFYLWLVEGASLPGSTLILTAPSGATALEPLTMTGQLTLADGSAPGAQPLEVTRQLPDGSTATLAGVTTAADGTFTITDTPPVGGTVSYGVLWDGSSTFRWSKTSTNVDVARHATSLSVSGPTTGNVRRQLEFTGVLSTAGQVATPAGSIVVVRAVTNRNGYTTTELPSVPLATDGSFTFTDTPLVGGQYTYHVRFDGDTTFLSAYTSYDVEIRGGAG